MYVTCFDFGPPCTQTRTSALTQCPVIDCVEVHGCQILTLCSDALHCLVGVNVGVGELQLQCLRVLIETPLFLPDVLVNMLAADNDAEPNSKGGIHVEWRFVLYGKL